MATKNGMIKKSSVSQFKTTRFNKPLVGMKVKDHDEIVNVIRLESDQLITVLTHKGMSLTYSTSELSDTGLRAAGVKSINLKDEDYVVMTESVSDSDSILMITQRGAIKRISYKVLQVAKRAQRGITLLKELKKNHIVLLMLQWLKKDKNLYGFLNNHEESGNINEVHLSEQYTNGSFIIDVDDFGQVVSMTLE